MLTRTPAITASCLFLLVASTQAGTILHTSDYGTYDAEALSGDEHDPVGRLTSKTFLCSGTLIDPQWVLTAAHCVDSGAAKNFSFTVAGTTYTGAERIAHPNWTGDLGAGWDIGLLKLKQTVPSQIVTPAVRVKAAPDLASPVVGTAVGFGRTGTGLSGATGPAGTKHGGYNHLDGTGSVFGWSDRILLTDFDDPAGVDNVLGGNSLSFEYETAPGDSGGGLFVNGALAGVVSLGWAIDGDVNSDYGDGTGFTSVASFNSWIDEVLSGGGSSDGGNSSGSRGKPGGGRPFSTGLHVATNRLAAPVPEPSAAWLAAVGLAGVVTRRRLRR